MLLFHVLLLFAPVINAMDRISGNLAKQCEFPFMASIRDTDDNHLCGGALVDTKWVLTSADCVINQNSTMVKLGIIKLDDEGVCLNVVATYLHQAYNGKTNNLALLKLEHNVISGKCVGVVSLKLLPFQLMNNNLEFIAWSGYDNSSDISPELRKITVNKVDASDCNQHYGKALTPEQMCVNSSKFNRAICKGETGSPLLYSSPLSCVKLLGVANYGDNPCVTGVPDVFEYIPDHYAWILSTIRNK